MAAQRQRQAEAEATAAENRRLEEGRRAVEERKARMVGKNQMLFSSGGKSFMPVGSHSNEPAWKWFASPFLAGRRR